MPAEEAAVGIQWTDEHKCQAYVDLVGSQPATGCGRTWEGLESEGGCRGVECVCVKSPLSESHVESQGLVFPAGLFKTSVNTCLVLNTFS